MFGKVLKIWILTALLAVAFCGTAFADNTKVSPNAFPFKLELDLERCDRLCYAGHPGSTVQYRDGLAATPFSCFAIEHNPNAPTGDINQLSVEINILYENDTQSGSYRESVKKYQDGDLELGEYYQLFSDNALQSLEDRGKLYSDNLKGVELTLKYNQRDTKKKTYYLYICDDDAYYEYLDNMPDLFDESEDEE